MSNESRVQITPIYSDHNWLAIASSNPNSNIFHNPAWSKLLADCYGYRSFMIAIADSNGEYLAGIPMMEVKSHLTGHRWISLPFSDHCEPLYCDEIYLRQLTDTLILFLEDRSVPRIELRGTFSKNSFINRFSDRCRIY